MSTGASPAPSAHAGPPPYDPAAVGRVASHVPIRNVELVGAHFERSDDGLDAAAPSGDDVPDFGISVEWGYEPDASQLACLLTFGTLFADEDGPYEIVARFRLTYELAPSDDISPGDMEQFAHWNAVFNAWPYWREYVASTLNRAHLPRFLVPVMGVPHRD